MLNYPLDYQDAERARLQQEYVEHSKAQARLRGEWNEYLFALCNDMGYYQLIGTLRARLQLLGHEDHKWLIAHNSSMIDWLRGRVPKFYEKLMESCRWVLP